MTFIGKSSEKLAAKCVVLSIDDFVESKTPIFFGHSALQYPFIPKHCPSVKRFESIRQNRTMGTHPRVAKHCRQRHLIIFMNRNHASPHA
jgi:hypothetical protein